MKLINPLKIVSILLLTFWINLFSQDTTSIAVIYNINSQMSNEIANYYASKRNIPSLYLLGISCVTDEVIDKDYYDQYIRDVVRYQIESRGIKDKIKYLVTTKGMPLKIKSSPDKCQIVQPGGGSIESFLCLLFYDLDDYCGGLVENLYYKENAVFNSFEFDYKKYCPDTMTAKISYLSSRLDAYTIEDVKAMIDRGLSGDLSLTGKIILDRDPSISYDRMIEANDNLTNLGYASNLVFDNSNVNIASIGSNQTAIGYCGNGSHASVNPFMGWDSSIGYLGGANFLWENGAAFSTYESFNANSFYYQDNGCDFGGGNGQLLGHVARQNLIADFIRDGGTVAVGNVYEPSAHNILDESIFFVRYLEGHYFIDAAYMSLPLLRFQNVVIGDPLCLISNKIHGNGANVIDEDFELLQNYPNPFNNVTTINFYLKFEGNVRIQIMDTLGEVVEDLVNGLLTSGNHQINFAPKNLASGTYLCTLIFNGKIKSTKLMLLK